MLTPFFAFLLGKKCTRARLTSALTGLRDYIRRERERGMTRDGFGLEIFRVSRCFRWMTKFWQGNGYIVAREKDYSDCKLFFNSSGR